MSSWAYGLVSDRGKIVLAEVYKNGSGKFIGWVNILPEEIEDKTLKMIRADITTQLKHWKIPSKKDIGKKMP